MREVLFSPPRRARRPWRLLPLVAFAGLVGAGCGQSEQCLDNRQFFEQKVWGNVMGKVCVKCHSPEGTAAEQNAKLLLLTPSYPAFLESNYANVAELAKTQYDGRSVLLRKPLGQLNHGGGTVIAEGSEEYKILQELVDRQENPVTCSGEQSTEAWKQNLTQLSPEATLRKASLDLVGRLPTLAETTRVKAGGEPELRLVLDDMMKEPAFIQRVKEIWNDVLLTNRYNSGALNLLNDSDYPGKYWYNPMRLPDNMLTDQQRTERRYSEIGVASEPLELIAYVVRENKPFKEILTAPYTMVNPYSARIYNLDPATLGFQDLSSYYEFRPATYAIRRNGMDLPVPHSGVFTQTVFLRRYPTTTTNLNRHRARMTYKYFLATDILRVAERPIDPSSVTSLNPTRDDPYCKVCHKVLDPIAGTFQKWDQDGRFQPALAWPTAMPQPGLGTAVLDNVAEYPKALSWLGDRITGDPRFTVATVQTIYKGLTGQDALSYPQEDMPDFAEHLTAWRRQQAMFQAIGDAFKADNYKLERGRGK